MSPRPDFVDVQLSAAGVKAAGDGPLRVANAHFHYEFTAGKPVSVTKAYEWPVLSQIAVDGEPLLEVVTAPPTKAAAKPAADTKKANPAQGEQGASDAQ